MCQCVSCIQLHGGDYLVRRSVLALAKHQQKHSKHGDDVTIPGPLSTGAVPAMEAGPGHNITGPEGAVMRLTGPKLRAENRPGTRLHTLAFIGEAQLCAQ